jgi:type IV secretory pathway VirB3-like protein
MPYEMMKSSLRKKAFYGIVLAIINFFGFMGLATSFNNNFIYPAILIPAAAGFYLLSLRCPSCGTRIYKRKAQVLGESFTYWGGMVIPKHCSQCNREL